MATLRPGRCYNRMTNKPWTRISIRRPRRSYVKGVPASKIHRFEMGNRKGNFDKSLYLVTKDDVQLRSNCLEAARVMASAYLTKKLTESGFFLKILKYPHHVLRENAMATGAGADRFSQGMRRSFGKPIGQAARLRENDSIMMIKVPTSKLGDGKEALRRAASKLSGSWRISIV